MAATYYFLSYHEVSAVMFYSLSELYLANQMIWRGGGIKQRKRKGVKKKARREKGKRKVGKIGGKIKIKKVPNPVFWVWGKSTR